MKASDPCKIQVIVRVCQKRHPTKSINISYAYIFAFSRRNSVLYIYQRLEHVNSVWHGTIVSTNNI